MKKQWSLLVCVVVIVLLSCKKDPAPERTTYFMDEEFLDYSIFKKGSWWIYQKDTLSPKDSVYVVKSELTTIAPDSVDYSWQRSEMQFLCLVLVSRVNSSPQHGKANPQI